ncbi:MAG TPA: tRNA (adenosine(37)-N6)-threonylcarbamoyltransferase complex transferase subunit TsaD [bacterium]|nr:tRNA (adenosine(37)-N6)-threonylcarbamoyltransferase complex transferase subunit TsaD [bacterium]
MLVLGVETSCDETAAAVVADGFVLRSNVIASQVALHRRFGGVVPELASRKHIERLLPVIDEALETAGLNIAQIEGLAVTRGPGLVGALTVGVAAAKAIALARELPFVGVNHLEGHIYAAFLSEPDVAFPVLALIVSGAHADLIVMQDHGQYEILGRSRDDAAGEAFDKVARAMGLGYPGGPEIDRLGSEGNPQGVPLPLPMADESWEFSFSGVKTAALRALRGHEGDAAFLRDLAASFQRVIVEVLVRKTLRAGAVVRPKTVVVAGGVAANSRLRREMAQACAAAKLRLVIPPPVLCTDNGAMIAAAGWRRLSAGELSPLNMAAESDLPLAPKSK